VSAAGELELWTVCQLARAAAAHNGCAAMLAIAAH
jgi:hypothetical protein